MDENKSDAGVGGDSSVGGKKENKTIMGVLSYLGPLVIISYAVAKDDPFVKFHIKQGLVLLVIEVVLWVLGVMFFWQLWALTQLINLAILILTIMGILNVVNGKEKELPVVGQFSHYFTF